MLGLIFFLQTGHTYLQADSAVSYTSGHALMRVSKSASCLLFSLLTTSLSAAPPAQIILAPDVEAGERTEQTTSSRELTSQSTIPTKAQQADIEQANKHSKLEDLYKRGLISKEVFEQRKPPKALTFEEKLARLKDLRSKGLITKEVYEARQKELLDANL